MDAAVTARLDLASPIETDPRWAAVIARDITADGAFVYAVTTTKIYCRPSCPARRSHPGMFAFIQPRPRPRPQDSALASAVSPTGFRR